MVPRREWMEFLDGLDVDREVNLVSSHLDDLTGARWRIRRADFDPFERVIEIVLDNDGAGVRLLIDDPRTVEFEGDEQSPSRISIRSDGGIVEVTGH